MDTSTILRQQRIEPSISLKFLKYRTYDAIIEREDQRVSIIGSDFIEEAEVSFCNNEILIDSIKIGEAISSIRDTYKGLDDSWYIYDYNFYFARYFGNDDGIMSAHIEEITQVIQWCEKYGIPRFDLDEPRIAVSDKDYFSGRHLTISTESIQRKDVGFYLFRSLFCFICYMFHVWIKAEFGNLLDYNIVKNVSVEICQKELREYCVSNIAHRLALAGDEKREYKECETIKDLLLEMLISLVFSGENGERFECSVCHIPWIRTNPKQVYCKQCSDRRYLISKRNKRVKEATNNAGEE